MTKIKKLTLPALLIAAVSVGSYFGAQSGLTPQSVNAQATTTAKPTEPVAPQTAAPATDLSRVFRTVHGVMKDAVVNINTSRKVEPVAGTGGGGGPGRVLPRIPEELRRFMPDLTPDEEESTPAPRNGQRALGTGSGVIVSASGYILTNNHVIEEADTITVRLDDGRELTAKVIGTDPKTDLAVIKIEADKLTYAKFGDSENLEVGDWVLAFGSPFGFDQTMTQGIISAKGRQVPIIAMNNPALQGLTYENFLQTDAAINPGNSGGPLVNLRGEIVGINTAIASRSGAYNGIGFAIPSNDAKYIMDSLIKTGKVVRGYMGVGIVDLRDTRAKAEAKRYGFTGETGVLVREVMADSPGGKGGLQLGDIITHINGKPVETINQLRNTVARTAPGNKIDLKIFRDKKYLDLSFAVGTQPDTATPVAASNSSRTQPARPVGLDDVGIQVRQLDAAQAQRYRLGEGKGLLITNVERDSLAAELGLRVGDVITRADRQEVNTPQELTAALSKEKLAAGVRLEVRTATGTDRSIYIEKK